MHVVTTTNQWVGIGISSVSNADGRTPDGNLGLEPFPGMSTNVQTTLLWITTIPLYS